MPRLVDDVRTVLEAEGFTTLSLRPDTSVLYFEDSTIMGHVHIFTSPNDLVRTWEPLQDDFLQRNASRLLLDQTKAWNLYTILLATEPAPPASVGTLFSIEDDFRGTRKIARAGVITKGDIEAALAPILPLRHLSTVAPIDSNRRLATRLNSVAPALQRLVTREPTEDLARSLLGDR